MSAALSSRSRILQGSLPKEMLRFGAPVAVGMGLQVTFNLVDAYVIARLEPEIAGPALGALGICDQLSAIGTIVSFGLTTASTAMIAQAHGRGDKAAVRRIVWQSLLAVAGLSILFGAAAILFAEPILHGVVGAKGAVATLGSSYLRVNSGGSFSIFFLLQLTAIQRALGSAKTPAALLVGSNVLNLLLAVLLVYGSGPAPPVFAWATPIAAALHIPRLELLGAAWATVIARTVFLVPVVINLVRRFDVFEPKGKRGPDKGTLLSIWTLAWPSSTQLVVRMSAMVVTHSLVARAFTTEADQTASTALGLVLRLETMALFVAMGWGSAAQTFVGQCIGAEQPARAVKSGWYAAAYCTAFMLAITLAYQRWGLSIVAFFNDDERVIVASLGYVAVVAWSYLALGAGVVLGSAITGSGATRTTLLTDVAIVIGFQIPACVLAVVLPGATLDRLWSALAATYALSGVAYVVVFKVAPWIRAAEQMHAKRRAEDDAAAPSSAME